MLMGITDEVDSLLAEGGVRPVVLRPIGGAESAALRLAGERGR
jgi:hypothetical protein